MVGFRPNHSTVFAFLHLADKITQGFNLPCPPLCTSTTAIVLTKAFNMVNHTKLISALNLSPLSNNTKRIPYWELSIYLVRKNFTKYFYLLFRDIEPSQITTPLIQFCDVLRNFNLHYCNEHPGVYLSWNFKHRRVKAKAKYYCWLIFDFYLKIEYIFVLYIVFKNELLKCVVSGQSFYQHNQPCNLVIYIFVYPY